MSRTKHAAEVPQSAPAPADIDLAAAVLDQVFQARSEGQTTLETAQDIYLALRKYTQQVAAREQRLFAAVEALTGRLNEHIAAVEQRHRQMLEKIERNTVSREDAEWEIKQLHSVMKTWHQHHVVTQSALIEALKALHLEREIRKLPMVPELPARQPLREIEHGCA